MLIRMKAMDVRPHNLQEAEKRVGGGGVYCQHRKHQHKLISRENKRKGSSYISVKILTQA